MTDLATPEQATKMKPLLERLKKLTKDSKLVWHKIDIWQDCFFYHCEYRGLDLTVNNKNMGARSYLQVRTLDVFGKYNDRQDLICSLSDIENLTVVIEATNPESFDVIHHPCIKDHRDFSDKVFDLISR